MELTPPDLWILRNVLIQAVKDAHDVLSEAARRERRGRRADEISVRLEAPSREMTPERSAAPAQPADKLAYTLKEASHALGLSRSTLYKLIGEGRIPTIRAGRRRLIEKNALDAFLHAVRTPER